MVDIHEALQQLKEVEKKEQLLEDIDPANREFLLKAQNGQIKPKIVKNGKVPYQMSDAWLSGEID